MKRIIWKRFLTCFLQIVTFICVPGKNPVAETIYVNPAKSYFVAIGPIKTSYGIALEIQPGRRVQFEEKDFFKIFPQIIYGADPKSFEVGKSAAKFNQNNQKRPNFHPVELWWFVGESGFTRIDELNRANTIYPGTVSILYFYIQKRNKTTIAQTISNHVDSISKTLINAKNSSNLLFAAEIKDADLTCDEILQIPVTKFKAILVWLSDDQTDFSIKEKIENLLSCQKALNAVKRNNITQIVLRGITLSKDTEVKLENFPIDYINGSLKIRCSLEDVSRVNPPCKYLKHINNYANHSPKSFALYNLNSDNAPGIAAHPNRTSCGVQENETNSWLRSPLKLSNGVGFSVFFDSKYVNYTNAILQELIMSSPALLIENFYELLDETTEMNLGDFLKTYAKIYNTFKLKTNEQRFIKIKLNMHPIDARDKVYITKWLTVAVNAAKTANQLSPDLVEGVICRFDKDNNASASRILEIFNEIKDLEGNSGIKLGVSFPSSINGCPYFLTKFDPVDLLLIEYDINLSIQCFGTSRPKFYEERPENYRQVVLCQSLITKQVQYWALIRVTKCKPSWQSIEEIDVQYSMAVERLKELAGTYGLKVYIGSAIGEDISSQDSCGWWQIHSNATVNGEVIIQNRKTSLRQKWYREPEIQTSSANLLWVWICLPFLILCIAVLVISGAFINKYQRKYSLWYNEVSVFFHGDTTTESKGTMATGNIDALAYNKEKYEISAHQHFIDEAQCLGSGEFGSVYHGTVTKDNKIISVAIKVTKQRAIISQHGNLVALRGLISEIKILSRVGEHDNIVRLIGAYTDKLKQGYVAVFLELCTNGSLLKHLRDCKLKLRENCTDLYENKLIQTQNLQESELLSNLMRWSYEIASGMEFLSKKHIVHADLATRNVLLSSDFVAKIADFGLSRRMYNYTKYTKTHQEPLPWRWMAPEALQSLQFDEKTDVWAYGVTLWEIFSLGDVPYPGLAWCVDFANQLNAGLRPAEPQYNHQEMYNLMLNCWNNNPEKRPTFAEMKKDFVEMFNSSNQSAKSTDYINII